MKQEQKGGGLIQFYKVLNGLDHISWKNNPEKVVQGDKNGPGAFNLRRVVICFRREPANKMYIQKRVLSKQVNTGLERIAKKC